MSEQQEGGVQSLPTSQLSAGKPLPAALADLALIDAATCSLAGGMSRSKWYAAVQAGDAPKPAVLRPRFVRWRVKDVVAYLEKLAATSHEHHEYNINRSKNAIRARNGGRDSAADKAKRQQESTASAGA